MYGILTLDAPQADSLGQPDLEIMKTLASLLGVGLALGGYGKKQRIEIPAQEIANHPGLRASMPTESDIPLLGMCGRLEPAAATRQRSRVTSYARYRRPA